MTSKASDKAKKILKIAANALLYLFLALCVAALLISMFSKRDKTGCVTLFGNRQMRLVESPSMAANPQTDVSNYKIKSIPVNSMVFIATVPQAEPQRSEFFDGLQIGDVITFRYTYATQETITHRLVDKVAVDGGYLLYLRGDNPTGDATSPSDGETQVIDTTQNPDTAINYVIGKVTGKSVALGALVSVVKKPVGLALFVIVPCAIIAVVEIVRIANVLSARKRDKVAQESAAIADKAQQQQAELELLRQRLSQLEQQAATSAFTAPPDSASEHNVAQQPTSAAERDPAADICSTTATAGSSEPTTSASAFFTGATSGPQPTQSTPQPRHNSTSVQSEGAFDGTSEQ